MKTKYRAIFLSLIMCISFILSGCGLLTRNPNNYLNRSVLDITHNDGTVEQITTESFISAYNNYASQYVQNGTWEFDEAVNKTVDVLVDRAVVLKEAKKTALNDEDNKEIWDEVYSALISNLETYADEVRKEWELEFEEPTPAESVVFEEYEAKAEIVLVDGEYKILILKDDDDKQTTNFSSIDKVKEAFLIKAMPEDKTVNEKIYKEAYRRMLNVLKSNEAGQGLSLDFDSILDRYIAKVEKNSTENRYLTNYKDEILKDGEYSTISVEDVFTKYEDMMLQSNFKYKNSSTAYNDAMLKSFKDVNYFVEDGYFFVNHLLVSFTESQKTYYANLEKDLKSGKITASEYTCEVEKLCSSLTVQIRDENGVVTEDTSLKSGELLKQLSYAMKNTANDADKAKLFNDYIYKYNQDPGVENAEYPYVIGEKTSEMVEEFTDAARELWDNGAGEFGDLSKLVATEYGVHILFYAGEMENAFEIVDEKTFSIAVNVENVEKLSTTLLSPFNTKTLFDKVYESLNEADNYSIFEYMNTQTLREGIKIKVYRSVLNNL